MMSPTFLLIPFTVIGTLIFNYFNINNEQLWYKKNILIPYRQLNERLNWSISYKATGNKFFKALPTIQSWQEGYVISVSPVLSSDSNLIKNNAKITVSGKINSKNSFKINRKLSLIKGFKLVKTGNTDFDEIYTVKSRNAYFVKVIFGEITCQEIMDLKLDGTLTFEHKALVYTTPYYGESLNVFFSNFEKKSAFFLKLMKKIDFYNETKRV